MPPTSTFLVDDSPSFLQSAARFLASDERIEIVGIALSAQEALAEVERLKPDLVLMDLTMPGMNGLEATRRLKASPNAPRVVILTLHDTDEYRQAALQANADGFIAKSDFGQKLLPLLEALLETPVAAAPPTPVEEAHLQDQPLPSTPGPFSSASPSEDVAAGTACEQDGVTGGLTDRLRPSPEGRAWPILQSPGQLPPVLMPAGREIRRGAFEASGVMSPTTRKRVLLAEDEAAISHLLAVNMWRAGVETRIAVDARAAMELFESFEPHLVLLDASSPRMSAGAVCCAIRARSPIPILMANAQAAASLPSDECVWGDLVDVEGVEARPEDVNLLTSRVLALLERFYRGSGQST